MELQQDVKGQIWIRGKIIRTLTIRKYDESPKKNYKKIEHEIELNKRNGDVKSRFEIRVNEIKIFASISNQILYDMKSSEDDGGGKGDKHAHVDISTNLKPHDNALGYAESHRCQTLH